MMRALNAGLCLILAGLLLYVGITATDAVLLWPLWSWPRLGMAVLGVVGMLGSLVALMYSIAIAIGEA